LQSSLSRTTGFGFAVRGSRRDLFGAEVLFASAIPTHAEKNGERRVLCIVSFETSKYRRFLPV
jgi:hypothetical protein